jgi:hypothetical protein
VKIHSFRLSREWTAIPSGVPLFRMSLISFTVV